VGAVVTKKGRQDRKVMLEDAARAKTDGLFPQGMVSEVGPDIPLMLERPTAINNCRRGENNEKKKGGDNEQVRGWKKGTRQGSDAC